MRNKVTVSRGYMDKVCDVVGTALNDCAKTCLGNDEFGEMATHFTKTTTATYKRLLMNVLFNDKEGE